MCWLGLILRVPFLYPPPFCLGGGLFPAFAAPGDALVCAVLFAAVALAAHTLEVFDVVVWFAIPWGDDVVDGPVRALEVVAAYCADWLE